MQPAWRFSRKLQWCVKCIYTHINGEIGVGWVCFTLSVTCWGAAEAAREERELQSPWSCPVSDISEDLEVGLGWECECSSEQAESREQTEKDRHVSRETEVVCELARMTFPQTSAVSGKATAEKGAWSSTTVCTVISSFFRALFNRCTKSTCVFLAFTANHW